MSEINELLNLVEDAKWHYLSKVAEKIRLNEFKVELIAGFLAEYEFISLDRESRRIRIVPSVLRFLRRIKPLENVVNE